VNLPLPLEINIHPGEHPTREFLGMTFNMDTIWVTLVAGVIVVALGFWARHKLTERPEDHVPTKIQLFWETVVGAVNEQVETNLGRLHPYVVPLATALFVFILVANWLEVIPSELNESTHILPSPTGDTNLTYAMALLAMVSVWTYGIRKKGAGAYFKHYLEPYPAMLPLEILQDLLKPVTLALRLFGNIFAGGIMLALISGLVGLWVGFIPIGSVLTVIFNVIWKLFDTMFLGGLQAFIFALLTVLYFGMAAGHGGDHEEHANADDVTADADREAEPELAA
jgi:F-type H+-transporting ATPase subunit a